MEVTVEHGEVELLQPGTEAGQEIVDELYLWWRENGSDSGAWSGGAAPAWDRGWPGDSGGAIPVVEAEWK